MKKIITAVSLMMLLTGCGGGGTAADNSTGSTTTASNNTTTVESAQVTSTAELVATPEFDFAAARTINIDFDVPEARTVEGMLSLCTKYSPQDDGTFDINYDSCMVQATLVNGAYKSQMELTNDINSVVGVVWFADTALAPVYKEFTLATTTAASSRPADASNIPTMAWH